MFILTIAGKEREGAYSVEDEHGDQILYLFEEEDDAERYVMMLEEQDYPEMNILVPSLLKVIPQALVSKLEISQTTTVVSS